MLLIERLTDGKFLCLIMIICQIGNCLHFVSFENKAKFIVINYLLIICKKIPLVKRTINNDLSLFNI